ncbi:MAG: GxxExxY protein [Deinococcales bacterium]|nr:GxxExxY protein [Chitinophagaceae bacterium]
MLIHQEITDKILKSFYNVYNTLGYGFLEKIYENSLIIELSENGLTTLQQVAIPVYYHEKQVGNYFADLLVENKVVIELKACESIISEHEIQLLNYLKATNFEVGLLLNFGAKPEFKRKVFSYNNK